ncbi:protein kinase [Nocardioides sp. 503]|uniref:protein kinase domain-containing protein n=1 Tax=Nocardioides sp. 503 TaxID=2508326 RepID=UPI00106FD274|nr:protein kinase [Nocardioides sp. 503]
MSQSVGRYRIDAVLGSGAMGVVYAATDTTLGRTVAMKVMSGALAASPEFRARFRREAEVLARLDSPHVVSIYDHGEADGLPYLITQLVAGGDLGVLLSARGPLPPRLALRVCAQVAQALAAAHAVGVVHRDVKPSNVLLRDPDAADLHAYLCDFGIAQTDAGDATALTQAGGVAGTWGYLAPERGRGAPASPASDVYALGCVLWAALSGAPPYTGSDIEIALAHERGPVPRLATDSALARGLNRVLARTLAKDPAKRPDAATLRAELLALEELEGRPTVVADHRHATRRRRRLTAVGGLALLLVVGATTAVVVGRDEDPSTPRASPEGPSGALGAGDGPVRGDLDGDGLGDVAVTMNVYEPEPAVRSLEILRSTGTSFDDPEPLGRSPEIDELSTILTGDFDGDGTDEVVGLALSDDREHTSVVWADGSRTETLPLLGQPVVGDFDGDGRDDLASVGGSDGELSITFLGFRDGYVADPEQWLTASDWDDDQAVVAGDFDGDGRDDLVFQTTGPPLAEATRRDSRLRLALSTGSGFTAPGRPQRYSDGGGTHPRAGDFDGDGADEVVLVPQWYDRAILVVDVDGSRLDPQARPAPAPDNPELEMVQSMGVSDVDGDGTDDLVVLLHDSGGLAPLHVARGGTDGLVADEQWADLRGRTTLFDVADTVPYDR